MSLEVIFAAVVGVLAGLGVIGALVFVLVWEWCAIRRALATHRLSTEPTQSLGRDHAVVTIAERQP
jgi:hypothetical protein